MNIEIKKDIYEEVRTLLRTARESIVSNVNTTMTKTYFLIGKRIVEEEQEGKKELNMEKI